MKIAVINDTHFGVKNDSLFFLEESLNFFEEQFFSYLLKNNIKTVLHLGDLMDRRKYVNFYTLNQVQKRFIEFFANNGIDLHLTIGNHDTFFKNTNTVNSTTELYGKKDNIHIHYNPVDLDFDGMKIALIPWITNDNEDLCLSHIETTSASILAGHFEINGFEVVTNIRHSTGKDPACFDKFDKVLSGHFHIRQSKGNIYYLGSQYQTSFGDVGTKKGFTVLDTETRELEFIENSRKVFHVIKYDDINGMEKMNPTDLKSGHIKVVVINKKKPKLFDSFIDILNSCEPQELTIIEEIESSADSDSEIDMTQDTISIISKEVDSCEHITNKEKIKVLIKEIYMECFSI
jgi:predicted phosphodiesterase